MLMFREHSFLRLMAAMIQLRPLVEQQAGLFKQSPIGQNNVELYPKARHLSCAIRSVSVGLI